MATCICIAVILKTTHTSPKIKVSIDVKQDATARRYILSTRFVISVTSPASHKQLVWYKGRFARACGHPLAQNIVLLVPPLLVPAARMDVSMEDVQQQQQQQEQYYHGHVQTEQQQKQLKHLKNDVQMDYTLNQSQAAFVQQATAELRRPAEQANQQQQHAQQIPDFNHHQQQEGRKRSVGSKYRQGQEEEGPSVDKWWLSESEGEGDSDEEQRMIAQAEDPLYDPEAGGATSGLRSFICATISSSCANMRGQGDSHAQQHKTLHDLRHMSGWSVVCSAAAAAAAAAEQLLLFNVRELESQVGMALRRSE
jgi:hypothetical protein